MAYTKTSTNAGNTLDPAYSRLLCHFDGYNDATSAANTGGAGSTITSTFAGGAKISTGRSKFGGSSLYLNGVNTSKVEWGNASQQINFGASDFTIECWVWYNTTPTGYTPILCCATSGDSQGPILITETNTKVYFYYSTNGLGWTTSVNSNYTPSSGAWTHFAVSRYGTNINIFANGTAIGTTGTTIGATTQIHVAQKIWNGHYQYFPGNAISLDGYVDECRITVGKARYTGNFTPSSVAFDDMSSVPQGSDGEIRYDTTYMYICTDAATNTWKKVALASL